MQGFFPGSRSFSPSAGGRNPGQVVDRPVDLGYNKENTNQNEAECIVAKNRHGEVGTVELIWDGQFTRFSNMDTSTPPEG